jgi:hypothetical protein
MPLLRTEGFMPKNKKIWKSHNKGEVRKKEEG